MQTGDRIIIEGTHVGDAPRQGVILEVIHAAGGVHYRVRWSDDHESTFFPAPGTSIRVIAPHGRETRELVRH